MVKVNDVKGWIVGGNSSCDPDGAEHLHDSSSAFAPRRAESEGRDDLVDDVSDQSTICVGKKKGISRFL
jgi:hypothetical protein